MATVRHRLSEIDAEARRAVCSVCGETAIRYRTGGRSECMTVRAANKFGAGTREQQLRRRRLREAYKLSEDDYDLMHAAQHGRCAICGKVDATETQHALVVDHDHSTGEVRGLLCNNCNVGLGFLQDDEEVLRGAVAYLASHSSASKPSGAPTSDML
jgi:hypothetical protein